MLPCLPRQPHDASSSQPNIIRNGDEVIIYESPQSMKAMIVKTNGRYDCKFGAFTHNDWIGRPYGSRVVGQNGRGWCYLLKPTPDLWSLVLKHRTQILYIADISLICMNLELRPGQVVLESGTGSASLTHSLCRAVAPSGHVYTYEFHSERAEIARKELNDHGLSSVVTVTHRDIMENGFPLEVHGPPLLHTTIKDQDNGADPLQKGGSSMHEDQKGGESEATVGAGSELQPPVKKQARANAVFLDLPGPWKVVENAAACLVPNGRFCSFSPCIEQVQRTCEALAQHGFTEINTIEVLLREYELKVENLYYTNDEVMSLGLIPRSQRRRGEDQGQGEGNNNKGGQQQQGKQQGKQHGKKVSGDDGVMQEDGEEGMGTKRKRENEDEEGGGQEGEEEGEGDEARHKTPASGSVLGGRGPGSGSIKLSSNGTPYSSVVTTRPSIDARGHTGYLTFARKFV